MAQFQTQVPHPLRNDLPCLLTICRMTTPAVRLLLLVFVCQSIFKCAAMQIQRDDVTGSEPALGELRHEQFVDHTRTGDPDPTFGSPGRMGRHDEPTPHALRPQRQVRTVVERARHPAFWVGQALIGRQFQASLDLGSLQDLRVFATHHKRQSG